MNLKFVKTSPSKYDVFRLLGMVYMIIMIALLACIFVFPADLIQYHTIRPQSNMLKKLPKMLLEYSQNFYVLCSSYFPLCLYYAPI